MKCHDKHYKIKEIENKKKLKEKKKNSVSKLKKTLWTLFSLYIRKSESKNEFCTCVTCNITKHYKQMQAGHFIPA
jgi:hypothetical protein